MIVVEAEKTLSNKLCRDETKYRPLLKGLIVEGLIKLLEPVVFVR